MLAFCAGAQSIPESEIARARHLLESPQWRDKAWGAYFAGRLDSEELTGRILDAFREAAALRDTAAFSEEHAYLAALFDAAIQSGMQVPAELLDPFEANWRAPVIILLARDADAEEALLRLGDENLRDVEWLAVNNLLLEHRSQRLFTKTLSQVEISHVFTLVDPGDNSGNGGGTGGMLCRDGGLAMPRGFPPIGVYNLVESPLRSDALVAKGPQNVYYRRFVAPTDKQTGIGVCLGNVDRQKMRLAYLDALANVSGQKAERLFSRETRIEYRNEANIEQRCDAALSAQEAAIRAFVRAAQEHGMGSVTGMTLKIVPKLDDQRKTTAGPTPLLAPREFVLE
jgi:hypothetical protein